MLDTRFKNKRGFCKLCHKLCFDTKQDAEFFIALAPDLDKPLTGAYECSLYPSGYWHVTSHPKGGNRKTHNWRLELKKLGPERETRLTERIDRILKLPRLPSR